MRQIRFCPACGHIPIVKIEEELLQKHQGILIGTVGCSVPLCSDMEGVDAISSAHGRGLSVATSVKRVLGKDKMVLVHAGDGDGLTIGIGEFVHTCLRNEKIIYVLINNQQFGMTGHQMSALTPLEITTKTSYPRKEEYHGIPVHVGKLVRALNPKVKYYRTTSATKEGINNFRKYLEEAINNDGFSVIEVVSPCPTFWGNAKKAYEYSKDYFNSLEEEHICNCKGK